MQVTLSRPDRSLSRIRHLVNKRLFSALKTVNWHCSHSLLSSFVFSEFESDIAAVHGTTKRRCFRLFYFARSNNSTCVVELFVLSFILVQRYFNCFIVSVTSLWLVKPLVYDWKLLVWYSNRVMDKNWSETSADSKSIWVENHSPKLVKYLQRRSSGEIALYPLFQRYLKQCSIDPPHAHTHVLVWSYFSEFFIVFIVSSDRAYVHVMAAKF